MWMLEKWMVNYTAYDVMTRWEYPYVGPAGNYFYLNESNSCIIIYKDSNPAIDQSWFSR